MLKRFIDTLEIYSSEYFVRITADCPLIDPTFIDRQYEILKRYGGDHIWLDKSSPVLIGQGVHSTHSLRYIYQSTTHPDDLEHCGSRYIAERPEEFKVIGLKVPPFLADLTYRIAVDELDDYRLMSALYESLWRGAPIPFTEALKWLKNRCPELLFNSDVNESKVNSDLQKLKRRHPWKVNCFCDWEYPHDPIS